MIAIVSFS